ncbi:MAG: ABC transporter permease [Oscillospiraceae bacterium]|nr:ABC transporter permease [Oscillospiraceae bacterium]
MISGRKIFALFAKDIKSLAYNIFIISGLLIMPVMAIMFTFGMDEPDVWLADFLIKMNILINGANIICVMIAEEKEKHTLSVLIASTVSGADFLISKVLVTGLLTFISNGVLYFIMGLGSILPFGTFMLMTGIAILPVTVVGAIIGLLCKTQAAASTAVTPVMMLLVFLPMFIPQESFFAESIFKYVFSEQMSLGLASIYNGEPFLSNIIIITINFAILATAFGFIYKKRGISA